MQTKTIMTTEAIDGDSNNNNDKKEKNIEDVDEYLKGYPWPPRSYSCSFCKREFKSAQALGGHMNVHRRDRARLQSSHYTHNTILHHENLKLITNPNPNPLPSPRPPPPSSSSSSSSSSPFYSASSTTRKLPPLTTSSSSLPLWMSQTTCHSKKTKWDMGGTTLPNPLKLKTTLELMKKKNAESDEEDMGCMKLELELEIGVLGGKSKDGLDLELRLGHDQV